MKTNLLGFLANKNLKCQLVFAGAFRSWSSLGECESYFRLKYGGGGIPVIVHVCSDSNWLSQI